MHRMRDHAPHRAEILEHAARLERRLKDHHSADVRDAETLRDAVTQRAAPERSIAEVITDASSAVLCGQVYVGARFRRPFGGRTSA
jgi:hypothetical protein